MYAAALNRRTTLERLGQALHQDPYKTPPSAPVLHIKPANTFAASGALVACPAGTPSLQLGPTIGLVIGRRACRVSVESAMSYLDGAVLAIDASVPYQSHFRPAIRERCRDGFLPLGSPVALSRVGSPDRVELTIEIDGVIRCRTRGSDLVRGTSALLSAVSAFVTLDPGDILLLGEPDDPPLVSPGQRARVTAEGFEPLLCEVVAEDGA